MSDKTSGEKLKELRLYLGVGLREAGRRSGLGFSYIYRLEENQRKNPSIPTINKIAKGLGAKPIEIAKIYGLEV
jgi:transcriptional regulator with XRE-family HTH domain